VGRASSAIGLISATVLLGPIAGIGQSGTTTSLRALTGAPELYANRAVTVTGRFRGRVPAQDGIPSLPPNRSRWDFLLNAEDSAVWISGIRPAGWDFDLDPLSPSDARTGTWLEVTGTVRLAHRTTRPCRATRDCRDVWIEATDLRAAQASSSDALGGRRRSAIQSPIVVFNDPINDEAGVAPSTAVRLQFSTPMIPETFSGRIRVAYSSAQSLTVPLIPRFTAIYSDATRSLAITFASPLASHQTVRVELLEGIVAANGRPFEPWGFVFNTGDSGSLPTLPKLPTLPTLKRDLAN
jgi:Bacterial Ig-like domain